MPLFLTECQHCNRSIRSDINYCHYCGGLVLSLPSPPGPSGFSFWLHQRLSATTPLRAIIGTVAGIAIFAVSFALYRSALTFYLGDAPATLPTPWIYSHLSLVVIVLITSFVMGSTWWALVFGVAFFAGYFGFLPHPDVSLGYALATAFVAGPVLGWVGAGCAHLGRGLDMKRRLLIALGAVVLMVVIGIARVSGL